MREYYVIYNLAFDQNEKSILNELHRLAGIQWSKNKKEKKDERVPTNSRNDYQGRK